MDGSSPVGRRDLLLIGLGGAAAILAGCAESEHTGPSRSSADQPEPKKAGSRNEYDALGERIEHQQLGAEGFELVVERVAEIEKRLGINDLKQFTPEA